MSEYLEYLEINIVTSFEEVLETFYNSMLQVNLKEKTAERHTQNVDLFLVDYYSFYYLDYIDTITPWNIYDFLGDWYLNFVDSTSEKEIESILTSLKRFFRFLHQRNHISLEQKKHLFEACDDKEYFFDNYQKSLSQQNSTFKEEFASLLGGLTDEMLDQTDQLFTDIVKKNSDLDLTISEMLEKLKLSHTPYKPKNNVIALKLESSHNIVPKNQQQQERPSNEEETIDLFVESIMDQHKANLLFFRWLDRSESDPTRMALDAVNMTMEIDMMLKSLMAQIQLGVINNKPMKKKQIAEGFKLLDIMDKTLWSARHKITKSLNIDLRQMPL